MPKITSCLDSQVGFGMTDPRYSVSIPFREFGGSGMTSGKHPNED